MGEWGGRHSSSGKTNVLLRPARIRNTHGGPYGGTGPPAKHIGYVNNLGLDERRFVHNSWVGGGGGASVSRQCRSDVSSVGKSKCIVEHNVKYYNPGRVRVSEDGQTFSLLIFCAQSRGNYSGAST